MQVNKEDRKNITSYRDVLGKGEGLQRGFTTGTCAQAASKAAAIMLREQKIIKEVEIELKGSVKLTLPVVNPVLDKNFAECGIIKDSGDDDDITHGHEFRSKVTCTDNKGIEITGGRGVGKVTKEGLPVKVGEWAINNNPRKMIIKSLTPLMSEGRGFLVEISVPDGEELAEKTWNPRLGIKGGISIIGTSGIGAPKSSKAYTAAIAISMNVVRKQDSSVVYIVVGYVGESFV
jgi:cobalt-precorrin-5B (C1)-methyltransferase